MLLNPEDIAPKRADSPPPGLLELIPVPPPGLPELIPVPPPGLPELIPVPPPGLPELTKKGKDEDNKKPSEASSPSAPSKDDEVESPDANGEKEVPPLAHDGNFEHHLRGEEPILDFPPPFLPPESVNLDSAEGPPPSGIKSSEDTTEHSKWNDWFIRDLALAVYNGHSCSSYSQIIWSGKLVWSLDLASAVSGPVMQPKPSVENWITQFENNPKDVKFHMKIHELAYESFEKDRFLHDIAACIVQYYRFEKDRNDAFENIIAKEKPHRLWMNKWKPEYWRKTILPFLKPEKLMACARALDVRYPHASKQ